MIHLQATDTRHSCEILASAAGARPVFARALLEGSGRVSILRFTPIERFRRLNRVQTLYSMRWDGLACSRLGRILDDVEQIPC